MILRITKINSQIFETSLKADDGETLIHWYKGNFGTRTQAEWAKICGCTPMEMAQAVGNAAALNHNQMVKPFLLYEVDGPATPKSVAKVSIPPAVYVRPLVKSAGERVPCAADTWAEALRTVLASEAIPFADPRMEWEDIEALACLDVDYKWAPTYSHLCGLIGALQPAPFLWHPSHGGGAKLYYHANNGWTANQIAALAGWSLTIDDPYSHIEVKRDSRHPFYPRSGVKAAPAVSRDLLCGGVQTDSLTPLGLFTVPSLSDEETVEAARERYLASVGWHVGMRPTVQNPGSRVVVKDHDLCPIAPGGPGNPVAPLFVGDNAVVCHYCQSKGYARPGERPGVMHYVSAASGRSSPIIRTLIHNNTHWTHAKYVLRHLLRDTGRMSDELLKLAYHAALKAHHGVDDPRCKAAMIRGADIIRIDGRWVSEDGSTPFAKDITPTLRLLPAVRYLNYDTEGNFTEAVDAEKVDKLKQTSWPAEKLGYPTLTPVCGFQLWNVHNTYRDEKIRFNVHPQWLQGKRAPQYLDKSERSAAQVEAAWKEIEVVFPGIDRNYLTLCLLMKAYSDAGAVQCPFVFVYGPAGSGKSTVPHVASGILGDNATNIIWTKDRGRLAQAVRAGSDAGTTVIVDEIFKEADIQKVPPRSAMDPFLNQTEGTHSHVMYVGSTPLGKNPFMVFTDVTLPTEVSHDLQLGRRIVVVRLDSFVTWAPTMAKAGISKPEQFRLTSDARAHACNVILSEAADMLEPIDGTPPGLDTLVAKLGFHYLSHGVSADVNESIKRFFALTCEAAPMTPSEQKRWGIYWRKVKRAESTPLNEAWCDVADAGFTSSRILAERDLSHVLGMPPGLRFESKAVEGSTLVKFFYGGVSKPTWANGADVALG